MSKHSTDLVSEAYGRGIHTFFFMSVYFFYFFSDMQHLALSTTLEWVSIYCDESNNWDRNMCMQTVDPDLTFY